MMIGCKKDGVLMALIVLFFGSGVCVNAASIGPAISDIVVSKPKAASINYWTPDRMKSAKELVVTMPKKNVLMSERVSLSNTAPIIIPNLVPDSKARVARGLSSSGRQTTTTGRVFWSCTPNTQYSCSGSVIPSSSGDLIVTAAQCVFSTTQLQWLINCNWVFVPGYSNGSAPYGIWSPRQVAALTAWTQSNPNYNYDVAFVALSKIAGRHISQYTGSESLGFNYARSQLTYAFGYPINIGNAQTLQYCSGVPAASKYTYNGYVGQGLSSCTMGGGIAGGPWLQQFNVANGVGIVYSLSSFFYSLAPNTINGPVFDGNVYALWSYMQTR